MTIEQYRSMWFWIGFAVHASCASIFQDLLGQDGYIQFARDYWTSSYITLPLAIAIVAAAWMRMLHEDKKGL